MKDIVWNKIRDTFEDLVSDRKSLVKILSVIVILLIAGILRIHGSHKSDIRIEASAAGAADAAEDVITETSEDTVTGIAAEEENAASVIFVDISGAVAEPGVYQIAEGTRLFEVVAMAGGLTEKADTDSVNQAAYVTDGAKIIIPEKGSTAASDAAAALAASSAAAVSASSSIGLININTAAKEELTTLNGIGDVLAGRIIEYRQSNPFRSKEDIKSVKGIGDGIFEKIKDDITI